VSNATIDVFIRTLKTFVNETTLLFTCLKSKF